MALISNQLDGPTYSDLLSTAGEGWGIVSTHRWSDLPVSGSDIDIYQYMLHQIIRVAVLAAYKDQDVDFPDEKGHDESCIFDNRITDVTTKPDSIAVPKMCKSHASSLSSLSVLRRLNRYTDSLRTWRPALPEVTPTSSNRPKGGSPDVFGTQDYQFSSEA